MRIYAIFSNWNYWIVHSCTHLTRRFLWDSRECRTLIRTISAIRVSDIPTELHNCDTFPCNCTCDTRSGRACIDARSISSPKIHRNSLKTWKVQGNFELDPNSPCSTEHRVEQKLTTLTCSYPHWFHLKKKIINVTDLSLLIVYRLRVDWDQSDSRAARIEKTLMSCDGGLHASCDEPLCTSYGIHYVCDAVLCCSAVINIGDTLAVSWGDVFLVLQKRIFAVRVKCVGALSQTQGKG